MVSNDLTYAYNGNQLTKVDDAGNAMGFTDVAATTDYTYDANGNLITDMNKGITNITYNHLNLPEVITLTGGTITFLYDANGNKLRKTVSGVSQDYLGGIEYSGGAIDAIYHEEGRATPTLTGWQYEYYLKDHLGNTRVIFTEDGPDADSEPDILQEVDYYPFGMTHNSPTATNHYLFNGIERQDDLNLNVDMAHFRTYDYAIGRWWQTDPRYDVSVSSYVGFGNNPVLLTDPLGDTTRVYSLQGQLMFMIDDNLPNQEHFIGDMSPLLIAQLNGAKTKNQMARIIRNASRYFVGENTRRELKLMSQRGDSENLEAPFVLFYDNSKELKVLDISDDYPTKRTKNSVIFNISTNLSKELKRDIFNECKYACISLRDRSILADRVVFVGFGHSQPSGGGRAGVVNVPTLMFSLADYSTPLFTENVAHPNFISTAHGYTIYSEALINYSGGPDKFYNYGHIYNYQGNMIIDWHHIYETDSR